MFISTHTCCPQVLTFSCCGAMQGLCCVFMVLKHYEMWPETARGSRDPRHLPGLYYCCYTAEACVSQLRASFTFLVNWDTDPMLFLEPFGLNKAGYLGFLASCVSKETALRAMRFCSCK